MNKVAMAFLTKDKTELTEQTVKPLLQWDKFALYWVDGSSTLKGQKFHEHFNFQRMCGNVRGGAGAGIVYALTEMLKGDSTHVGLCEQDVLLPMDWFEKTMSLFDLGCADGLPVGAVSARCFVDRVLWQRDYGAVCFNLGAGTVVFTREAAQIVLNAFRSGWTADNRRIFCQLSNTDIGPIWCFKNNDHPTTADWKWDSDLAAHGLASLALTPSHVQMIGQDPPLAQQGLTIADGPVTARIDDAGFNVYRARLQAIRHGALKLGIETVFQKDDQGYTYLPHQLHMIGGRYSGDWRFKEMRAFGEFTWVAGDGKLNVTAEDEACGTQALNEDFVHPSFTVPIYGLASLLLSGGKNGGSVRIVDEESGYSVEPFIPPEGEQHQCLQVPLPATVSYRTIRVTALSPGICFYKIVCQNKQPVDPTQKFNHSVLPVPV